MQLCWRMNCLKKKPDPYFVTKLPNGKQLLYRCEARRWEELIDIVKYFKDEYGAETLITNISKREAKKYLKGQLFNAHK